LIKMPAATRPTRFRS